MNEPAHGYIDSRRAATNGLAISSLVLGILGFLILPTLGSVLAIVFGLIGLRRIRRNNQRGAGLAKTGLSLGCAAIVLWVLVAVVAAVFVSSARNASAARDARRKADLQQIATQLKTYYHNNPNNSNHIGYPAGDYSSLASILNHVPSDPLSGGSHPNYTYTPYPAGCVEEYPPAGTAFSLCMSYILSATLEHGGNYSVIVTNGD